MSIKYRSHIPAFAECGQENSVVEFSDLKALVDHLTATRLEDGWTIEGSGNHLMMVAPDRLDWWVLGFTDADLASLPKWRAAYLAKIGGRAVRLDNGEVVSSCGDVLTLKDGRKVRNIKRTRGKGR